MNYARVKVIIANYKQRMNLDKLCMQMATTVLFI